MHGIKLLIIVLNDRAFGSERESSGLTIMMKMVHVLERQILPLLLEVLVLRAVLEILRI